MRLRKIYLAGVGKIRRATAYSSPKHVIMRLLSWRRIRVLAPRTGITPLTVSAGRLNALAHRMPQCMNYLEIGVESGATLENVEVPMKTGVDPAPRFDTQRLPKGISFFGIPSDMYFENERVKKFDLVFVDGLHTWAQAYRDVIHSLQNSPCHALVLLDDCVPQDELSSYPDLNISLAKRKELGQSITSWCGDVFRVIYVLRRWHPELMCRVIAEDVGAILPSGQGLIWRTNCLKQVEAHNFSVADKKDVESLSWHLLFSEGKLPDFFRAGSEEEIFTEALNASRINFSFDA